MERQDSTIALIGKRLAAWAVLVLVVLIALKLAVGLVIGVVQMLVTAVLVIALFAGVVWALRHV